MAASHAAAAADTVVRHVVLTGGPSAGKTSARTYLTEQLTARGWRVLFAAEAATLVISGGVHDIVTLAGTDRRTFLGVQHEIVGLQLALRARFDALARTLGHPRTVVLHDRGVLDNGAYLSAAELEGVLAERGLTVSRTHDLYDAVVHLRSAAVARDGYDGSGYTTATNAARSEDAATAAALDAATLAAWASHPHLAVIPSTGAFSDKLQRALAAVLAVLGDPEPVETERKFVLDGAPDLTHPAFTAAPVVSIEQVYLPAVDGAEQRVRARTLAGETTYTHTTKRATDRSGVRVEVESAISEQTYRLLCAVADPATVPVRKRRWLVVDGDQRFEVDEVLEPVRVWLVEAELVDAGDEVHLPAFLPPAREVTDDPAWTNRALATRPT